MSNFEVSFSFCFGASVVCSVVVCSFSDIALSCLPHPTICNTNNDTKLNLINLFVFLGSESAKSFT